MSSGVPVARPTRRVTELARTAVDAARLVAGNRMANGQALRSLPADVDAAMDHARTGFGIPAHWAPRDRLPTVADVAVVELRAGPELAAVLKVARTPAGDAVLLLQQETLQRLAAQARLGPWRRLLPAVLAHGTVGARRYSVEKAVRGTVGTALPGSAGTEQATARAAVRAVSQLHRATGRVAVASPELVDRWLEPGLSLVADTPMLLGPARRRALVDRLRDRIHSSVAGREVWLATTHGDYFPGNIFFAPTTGTDATGPGGAGAGGAGAGGAGADGVGVAGIIDWAQSREDDPALIDPMTFLLIGRARAQGRALGRVVRDLCRGAPLSLPEAALLAIHRAACPADPVGVDVMALLAWLRHVENNLLKSPRYRVHPAWLHANVETVLRTAGGTAP